MDSRQKIRSVFPACIVLLACALPAAAAGPDPFESSIRAPLSSAQAAELRAATEAASFSAQASRGASISAISQAQGQPQAQTSSYRLNAASPLQPSRLIPVSAIPEAPGWMVFVVCLVVALFVARRGGPRG